MLNHELAMLQVRLTAMLQVRLTELEDAADVLVMIELPRDFGGKPEASNNRANSWRCAGIARLRRKVTAVGGDVGAPGPTGAWSTRVRSHPQCPAGTSKLPQHACWASIRSRCPHPCLTRMRSRAAGTFTRVTAFCPWMGLLT